MVDQRGARHPWGRLLTRPGVARLALFGLLGRLPGGMLGLALTLTTVEATGSYATAGTVVALYTLAAGLAGPLWGRGADRVGPRWVLLVTGLGQPAALLALAALAPGAGSAAWLVALGGVSGALLPPLGAVMRSLWSRLLAGEPDLKAAAFAYESVVVDVVFIAGPSLVAGLSALARPGLALVAAAAATLAGCLPVAASPHIRQVREAAGRRDWLGPLRHAAVLGLLPVGFLLLGSIAAVEVSLVSFAGHIGRQDLAGVLVAALSVGGVAGGVYWGSRRQPGTNAQQLAVLLGGLAAGWGLLALPAGPWALGGLLLLAGLALNPAITAAFSTMDDAAPQAALTESFGWLNALGSAGGAAGAAVAGSLVQQGATAGFLLAAGMCGAACAIACLLQPWWQPARRAGTASCP